jgi:PIN domain nuclease of toxin-antitoxin system
MSVLDAFVVDTHALIWYLEGNPRLGPGAKRALDDPASRLYLPAIALAEALWVIEQGRCSIPTGGDLLSALDADPRLQFVPLDRRIIERSLNATSIPEMHDRHIVATAHELSGRGLAPGVLTRDSTIRASGLVTVIW